MKKILVILYLLLASQYILNAQTFNVSIDTLHVNLKEIFRPASKVNLTHAVKYKNKYYCFFEERGLYSFKEEEKYFLILERDGTIFRNVKVPKDINNSVYYDFFIRNDSLLSKTYMDHFSFYFDLQNLEWLPINEVDDQVFEDENFKIKYLDFGEWGQTTWFIDKKNSKEYLLDYFGTIINKINSEYYLTTNSEVIMINDPSNLKVSNKNYYYEIVEKERKFHEGTNSIKGSKAIYRDSTIQPFSFEIPMQSIETSFVYKNQLFQLVTDSSKTYIARIENDSLISIQDIGPKFSTYNWYYSYRGNNLSNNGRFLKFKEGINTYGFVEIDNNKIDIHYLKHNIDSLRYIGSDGFEKLLDYVKNNIDNLSLEKANSIEKSLGGINLKSNKKGNAHNGYYPNEKNFKIEGTKEYIKVLDENIAQTTEYFYTSKNNLVKAIFIEWTQTQPYVVRDIIDFAFDEDPSIKNAFIEKFNEIRDIVTLRIGQELNKGTKNSNNVNWHSSEGINFKLYYNGNREIRMIIYKE